MVLFTILGLQQHGGSHLFGLLFSGNLSDDGGSEGDGGTRTLARGDVAVDGYEFARGGGSRQELFEAGITRGLIALEQAGLTQNRGGSANGGDMFVGSGMALQQRNQGLTFAQVFGAGHTAGQNKPFNIVGRQLYPSTVGSYSYSVGSLDLKIARDGNRGDIDTGTAQHIYDREGFQLFKSCSEK